MIRNVQKRDGSIVEFDADKINRWAVWASEKCGIAWSDVVIQACRGLSDTCTTSEIQQALIAECVNKQDTKHARMAANLLLGQIYKEAYGGIVVKVFPSFYREMVDAGLWCDVSYTDEELARIDQYIDHGRDVDYEYCTLRQFSDKYSVSVHGRCLESPQMAFMMTAIANTRYEEDRVSKAIALYDELSLLKMNIPTPSLVGERTPVSGSPSCVVITGGDSVDSIEAAVHVAYKMTAMGSGIGCELDTRAPKDPVKGGLIEHMGKDAYYRYMDRGVKSNKQQTRGGSATMTFSVHDPEVENIIRYKSQRTLEHVRLDTMDYSMAVTNLFMQKAAKNEDWMLVSVYHAPRLYELSRSSDHAAYVEEYNRVLSSDVKKIIVPARSILKLFWSVRSDTGRVYRSNLTSMNTHTPFKDPIRLSNLCVAPETMVLTDAGNIQIRDLVGKRVNVWNGEEWSGVDVVKTGENQKLIRVVTDSGYELECTPYHKMFVVDSYHGNPREVRAGDLKPGDKLIKFELPVIEGDKILDNAYDVGFYAESGGYFVPDATYSAETRRKWFAGFEAASSAYSYREEYIGTVVFDSTNREFLIKLQAMLQSLGVFAKVRKSEEEIDSWNLAVSSHDVTRLLGLDDLPPQDDSHLVVVVAVEDNGRFDDTYCFTEPKRHMAMFNGILTGQCQEIALPTAPLTSVEDLFKVPKDGEYGEIALCFLSSIVAGRMPTDESGELKHDDYFKTAYQVCKFVDNTIEKCSYPFPMMERTAKARRSIGIGLTDVAHYMAKHGYRYDSLEGRNALHRMAELHSFALHKASVQLAKERGACEWIDKTKYSDDTPWLPIDTYSIEVDKHHTQDLLCDWEGLRQEIKEHGVRFSVHESFMPVESSSVLTGSTNSLYPVRDMKMFKKSPKGTVYFEVPGIEEFGNRYQNAYSIAPQDMAIVYAIFQKFCGQSISADFYQDLSNGASASMSDFYKLDFFATKLGLKTYYYLNTLTKKTEKNVVVEMKEVDCEACSL